MTATRTPRPARRTTLRLPAAGLGLLLLATLVILLYTGRGGGFYFDDWNFVLERGDWSPGEFLNPHNEHLSFVPVLVYKLLFVTVGLEHYWVYRLMLALVHCATLAAMYAYARPRIGSGMALLVPAAIAVYGAAYYDLLWAFQIGYAASLLSGVLAFLALDRGTRRGDLFAAAMVCTSLGSSSVGLCVFVAVAVEVLATGWRRRWHVVAIPFVLYALWWIGYRAESTGLNLDNVFAIPTYCAAGIAAVLATLSGYTAAWGAPLAILFIALLLLRVHRSPTVPWRLVALLLVPLTFWTLAAIARADQIGPETSRYLYPPAVFVLLAGAEALSGRRVYPRYVAFVAVVVVAGSWLTNGNGLRGGGQELASFRTSVYGGAGALEMAGEQMDPDAALIGLSPQIINGRFVAAVERFGTVVGGEPGVLALPDAGRQATDAVLQAGLGLGFVPADQAAGGAAPSVETVENATVEPAGACLNADSPAGGVVTVAVPSGDLYVAGSSDASVTLRRYADGFVQPPLPTGGARPVLLRLPADNGSTPWRARVAFTASARICGG